MTLRTCLAALTVVAIGLPDPARPPDPPAPEAKPLSVLFLGNRNAHRPAEQIQQFAPVLAGRGIERTYSDKVSDRNLETLATCDALVIYPDRTQITKDQKKTLLEYVSGGGRFVLLHCASFCFLNSPESIALVGAQFQNHGTGQFVTTVADPDHPIIKGLEPFRTWDQTYVHPRRNTKDRHVLQTRDDQTGSEPWTWTRTHGKGRGFSTAYGHDARTWGRPGFHDMVERGIRWAANRGDVLDSRPRVATGLKPFDYEKAESPLYTPGARCGTLDEPIKRMQKPLSPEESIQHLALPGGFKAKLFASERQIGKPITMTWNHRGRLYVAESVGYPNEIQPRGHGLDRISIVEDILGDGRADEVSLFADNLSIPTSLCYANDGLCVAQAADMLFLKDTDGDGKADERKVLFTGFKTNDTHAGLSNRITYEDGSTEEHELRNGVEIADVNDAGRAMPMLVVRPNGCDQMNDRLEENVFASAPAFAAFEKDLLEEVIPAIKSKYSVYKDREHRALGSLSIGGVQSLNFGLAHRDTFAWIGGFSSASNTKSPADLIADPDAAKKQIKLQWVACGNKDNLLCISQGVHAYLKEKGIEHVWHVDRQGHDAAEWRNNLDYFAQKLFL